MILPARHRHSLGSHEDENGICARRPGRRQQSSTRSARSVPTRCSYSIAPGNRGIDFHCPAVESPLPDNRYPRLVFPGLDGVHPEWAGADSRRALDCSSVPPKAISRSGAAYLFMPDDHLHVRDLDSFLSKLTCINPPGHQTKMSQALMSQRTKLSNDASSSARSRP